MSDDLFEKCLPFTLAQECPYPNDWSNHKNFSNDRHDPGGATMCGIIQREYDHWRKAQGLSTRPVIQLTQEEGYAIYRASYWLPHCPSLPAGLDLSYFDTAVNMGSTEAVRILQVTLGIENDGQWGEGTQAAVEKIDDPTDAIRHFALRRHAVYQEMPGFRFFGTDWTRRTNEIELHSIDMVVAAVKTET